MNVRTLRWWSAASLDRAAAAIAPVWRGWCFDWDVDSPFTRASNASDAPNAAADLQTGLWTPLLSEAPVWLRGSGPSDMDTAALLLFPSMARAASTSGFTVPPIARAAATSGWNDLRERLQGCLAVGPLKNGANRAPADPPVSDLRCWSGAIQLAIGAQGNPAMFHVHLSASAADAFLDASLSGRRRSLPSPIDARTLVTAIEAQQIGVRAEIDGAVLDLATVESLRGGDVLPLRHRLDEPLHVNVRSESGALDATALCSGLLGARGKRRAVELLREAA